jgi:hypothetical protein
VSRFLRAGLLRDRIDDIVDASSQLVKEINLGDQKLRRLAADIRDMALDLRDFIDRWDCEPLIYTGRGSTDEIISLLDGLLSKAEGMMRDLHSKGGQQS